METLGTIFGFVLVAIIVLFGIASIYIDFQKRKKKIKSMKEMHEDYLKAKGRK